MVRNVSNYPTIQLESLVRDEPRRLLVDVGKDRGDPVRTASVAEAGRNDGEGTPLDLTGEAEEEVAPAPAQLGAAHHDRIRRFRAVHVQLANLREIDSQGRQQLGEAVRADLHLSRGRRLLPRLFLDGDLI